MPAAGRTFYAAWPAWGARLLIVAVIALSVWPLRPHTQLYIPGDRQWNDPMPKISDAKLYRAIVSRIEKGENYYPAAAAEQRARGYATAPAQTFRQPTLAYLLAGLRAPFIRLAALYALFGTTVILLFRELVARQIPPLQRILAIAAAATGLSVVGVTDAVYWHEVWAALLIALSLFIYSKNRWWPSVLLGLAACLIREIALPYLLVMAAFSFLQGRWKEFFAWAAAISIFIVLYLQHVAFAGAMYKEGDIASAGWVAFGGWDFVIATVKWNNVLHVMPAAVAAFAACLGVIGLAGARDERAWRACLTVGGYMVAFLIVGRSDNYYWGILYAPLLSAGFIFAPLAIVDIGRRAFSPLASMQSKAEKSRHL